jgi:glycosyltransferase involved in cell wall biosynthesis
MTKTACRISIIVPAYNAAEYLQQSLGSIRKSSFSDFELIAVDDCSTDGSLEIEKKFADKVVKTDRNMGPAAARNLGADESSGPVLFFLDADVKLHPDTLLKVVNSMAENPSYSAIFGSYDAHPAQNNFFSQYKNLFHHFIHQNAKSESSTFWAGCGSIRRKDFEAIGGFSKNYASASIEDVEMGYRLKESGRRIKLDKDIQVTHLKKWTLHSLMKADILYRAIPWSELAVKRGLPYDLNFKLLDRLSAFVILLMIGCSILSCFWYPGILVVLGCAGMLLISNRRLYIFFLKKRGIRFAFFSVLFHWFYFFYSSITFVLSASIFRFLILAQQFRVNTDTN